MARRAGIARRSTTGHRGPVISFVVPTAALSSDVFELAQNLVLLNRGRCEVFISLDRNHLSASESKLALALDKNVTVLASESHKPEGPARARNRGAKFAQETFLVFVDSDMWVSPFSALRLVDRLLTAGPFDLGTVRISGQEVGAISDFFAHGPFSVRMIWGRIFFPSAVLIISRKLFESVGGFDESFPDAAGEDWDLLLRIYANEPAIDFAFHSDIIARHRNPTRLSSLLRRALRYGLNAHRYLGNRKRTDVPGLGRRALDILIQEILIPANRALRDIENALRGRVLPRKLTPLNALKLAALAMYKKVPYSAAALSESRQEFLLAERVWFRLSVRVGVRTVEGSDDQLWIFDNDGTKKRSMKHLDTREIFSSKSSASWQHSILNFAWRTTHKIGVLLGYLARAQRLAFLLKRTLAPSLNSGAKRG